MSKEIKVFRTIQEAIEVLNAFDKHFTIQMKTYDKETIIKKSVDSSIYRAFQNLPIKPSEIYRPWLSDHFADIISNSKRINSKSEFDKLVLELTNSLLNHWKESVKDCNLNMQYGPASKISNLIFKMIQESEHYRVEKIQKYLHVPFDEYSLKPLQLIINDLTDVNYKILIPRHPAMSFITTPELYQVMQSAVGSLSKMSGIYPIVYDYWAWNDKH